MWYILEIFGYLEITTTQVPYTLKTSCNGGRNVDLPDRNVDFRMKLRKYICIPECKIKKWIFPVVIKISLLQLMLLVMVCRTPKTPSGSGPLFKFTDPAVSQSASTIKERLLKWCQMKTKEYEVQSKTNEWWCSVLFFLLSHS